MTFLYLVHRRMSLQLAVSSYHEKMLVSKNSACLTDSRATLGEDMGGNSIMRWLWLLSTFLLRTR
jgi:hypothetical protein